MPFWSVSANAPPIDALSGVSAALSRLCPGRANCEKQQKHNRGNAERGKNQAGFHIAAHHAYLAFVTLSVVGAPIGIGHLPFYARRLYLEPKGYAMSDTRAD